MKKIKKIYSKLKGMFIKIFSYLNLHFYMKHYVKYLQSLGINIPDYDGMSFISADAHFDGSGYPLITIGHNVTISTGVRLFIHDYSINKAIYVCGGGVDPTLRSRFMKPIVIKDRAFIGARSILLPGTIVGENSIIGAGSIVHGVIPDNVVAAGNPAKVISSLTEWTAKHIERCDFEQYRVKPYKQ